VASRSVARPGQAVWDAGEVSSPLTSVEPTATGDAALDGWLRERLTAVEDLLRASVHSRYGFVTDLARHLIDAGGKRVRPLVVLLAAAAAGGPGRDADAVVQAAVTIELTHLSTLYHDDVIDEAPLRRGAPSVNSTWGNTLAICGGDFLFARAAGITAQLGAEPTRILADTIAVLCEGEMRESVGPQADEDPVEHHLGVLAEKTGSLFGTSGRLGAMLAGGSSASADLLAAFGARYGVAFQLSDDLIDVLSDSGQSGKTPGTDLRAGVPTLPTLLAVRSGDDPRLSALLAAPVAEADVVEALTRLRASGGLAQARATLAAEVAAARSVLEPLAASPARAALERMADALVSRTR